MRRFRDGKRLRRNTDGVAKSMVRPHLNSLRVSQALGHFPGYLLVVNMPFTVKGIRDKKLRGNLKSLESKYKTASLRLKDSEILHENTSGFLEPETSLERTYKVRQDDIVRDVPIEAAKKRFDLKLDVLGPYVCDYTKNGRDLLLGGRKGHVATMDWREGKLGCELQLGETVRDAKWLHNNQMFAVAQKKYVYIYDRAGVEVHCLKKHIEVTNMEFLPYHYLLATVVRILFSSWA